MEHEIDLGGFASTQELLSQHGHALDVFREEYQKLKDDLDGSLSEMHASEEKVAKLEDDLASSLELHEAAEEQNEEAQAAEKGLLAAVEAMEVQAADLLGVSEARRTNQVALQEEIASLQDALAKGSGWTDEQEREQQQLVAEIDNLQEQLDRATNERTAQLEELNELSGVAESEERRIDDMRKVLEDLLAQTRELQEEGRLESARKEGADVSLAADQEELRRLQAEHREKQGQLRQGKEHMAACELVLRQSKESVEAYLEQYGELYQVIQQLSKDVEQETENNKVTEREIAFIETRNQAAVADKANAARERSKLLQLKALVTSKTEDVERERKSLESKQEILRAEVSRLTTVEARSAQKAGDALQRQVIDLRHELGILDRKIDASSKAVQLIEDLRRVNEVSRRNLEDEVACYKASIKQKRGTVINLTAARRALEVETEAMQVQQAEWLEKLKLQEAVDVELKEKIALGKGRLKQQQNLYEAVRSDRNAYSRSLISVQEGMKSMKRTFKMMSQQIEQLKEDITAKDHSLVKEHFHHHNSDKEREAMSKEVTKTRKQIASTENIVQSQAGEVQKLSQIIADADSEHRRQVKEHAAIVAEREALTRQLHGRHTELTGLYEKIRIQTNALYQGETRYRKLAAEIRALQRRVAEEKVELQKALSNDVDASGLLAREIEVQTALLAEKGKVKALSDELEIPLNIHRWRQLESSDPKRFMMICKLQSLRQRLISKRQEALRKEGLIREKERLCDRLKASLCRQPGAEAEDQLLAYEESLKSKARQMRAMEDELQLYRQQVDVCKEELAELAVAREELQEEWLQGLLSEMKRPDATHPRQNQQVMAAQ